MDLSDQTQQSASPYTEFFSWGSDSDGQLALANSDDDTAQYYKQSQFYELPKSLSFDILISQISCGDNHAAFISGEGFTFSVGKNTDGQLGVGDPSLTHSSAPLLIDSLPKGQSSPLQISCGGSHSAILYSNGEIYVWGQGQFGALGIGSQQNVFAPQRLQSRESNGCKFIGLDAGKRQTMTIDSYGQVYVCGDNQHRQLGLPHTDRIFELIKLPEFPLKACKVASGIEHSLILTDEDKIYACGNNSEGNLGLGHTYSSDSFLQVHGMGNHKVKQISAGRHSAAITDDGRLYVWGPVFKGDKPLLLPQELRSNKLMLKISVGEKVSAVIDEDSHVYTWGTSNNQGQLGRRTNSGNDYGAEESQKMPQIVENLASKVITQVVVGQDFVIALGQDYDENGIPFEQQEQNGITNRIEYQVEEKKQAQSYSPYSVPTKPLRDQSSLQLESQLYTPQPTNHGQIYTKPPLNIGYERQSIPPQQITNYQSYSNTQSSNIKQQPIIQQQQNISVITSSSSKSKDFRQNMQNEQLQYSQSRAAPNLDSQSSINNSMVIKNHSTPPVINERPVSGLNSNTYSSNTTSELYKQLDGLREETFSLKQKNRELQQSVNLLKDENDQLMKNAEEEIKRMSGFLDQYTAEFEENKKQQDEEMALKVQQERMRNEDMKQKLFDDQAILQDKLDRMQKDYEALRNENQELKQEKTQYQHREIKLNEQLQQAQQKLNQNDISQSRMQMTPHGGYGSMKDTSYSRFNGAGVEEAVHKNMSPLVTSKTQENFAYQTSDSNPSYVSRSPLNVNSNNYQAFNSRQNVNQRNYSNKEVVPNQDTQSRPFSQEPHFNKLSSQRENQFQGQIVNMRQREPPQAFAPIEVSRQEQINYPRENSRGYTQQYEQNQLGASPMYASRKEQVSQNFRKERDSPKRLAHLLGISSPIRQEIAQESLQPSDFIKGGYSIEQDENKYGIEDFRKASENSLHNHRGAEKQHFGQQQYNVMSESQVRSMEKQKPMGSPMRNIMDDAYKIHQNMQSQLRNQSSNGIYSPNSIDGQRREEKENSQKPDGTTLNDVKGRLAVMQRNKEDLEDKLKAYEAKIKQHFNR